MPARAADSHLRELMFSRCSLLVLPYVSKKNLVKCKALGPISEITCLQPGGFTNWEVRKRF